MLKTLGSIKKINFPINFEISVVKSPAEFSNKCPSLALSQNGIFYNQLTTFFLNINLSSGLTDTVRSVGLYQYQAIS